MNSKILKGGMVFVAIVLAVGAGCALHDDLVIVDNRLIALKKRVSKLDHEAETLRSDMSRYHDEQVADRTRDADLRALMNDLRDEIQELRGQLEESRYHTQHLAETGSRREEHRENLEKALQSSVDRIVRLEQYLGMEPSEKLVSPGPSQAESDKDKTSAKKTPDDLYVAAKQQFDRAKYEAAREQFQAFLKEYPKSENADNAQFWIGEIYFREKWYEKAILEYQKVIESYPKGNKLRSALLKQGFAFLNLGDKDNARLILKELVRKYADSNEAKIAREKLKNFQ
jgi:tol-pal system protein YbgF